MKTKNLVLRKSRLPQQQQWGYYFRRFGGRKFQLRRAGLTQEQAKSLATAMRVDGFAARVARDKRLGEDYAVWGFPGPLS